MKTNKDKLISIPLPALLRRVHKAYALKALIRAQGCQLTRIGRSRNWQLKATLSQIQLTCEAIEQQQETSWQWLVSKLLSYRENLTFDMLLEIAQRNPNISVSQLMALTDCSISEARRVIDHIEFGE